MPASLPLSICCQAPCPSDPGPVPPDLKPLCLLITLPPTVTQLLPPLAVRIYRVLVSFWWPSTSTNLKDQVHESPAWLLHVCNRTYLIPLKRCYILRYISAYDKGTTLFSRGFGFCFSGFLAERKEKRLRRKRNKFGENTGIYKLRYFNKTRVIYWH